ncbi:hypothetical protein B2J88_52465, partial [Rhodococcus sp. SRB_17]|nr:hypothetical protein [Rhodococcus sp. SRB_17]
MSSRFELESPEGGTFEDDPLALVPGTKRRKPRPRLRAAVARIARIAGYRMDGTGLGWVSVGVGV